MLGKKLASVAVRHPVRLMPLP